MVVGGLDALRGLSPRRSYPVESWALGLPEGPRRLPVTGPGSSTPHPLSSITVARSLGSCRRPPEPGAPGNTEGVGPRLSGVTSCRETPLLWSTVDYGPSLGGKEVSRPGTK